MFTFRATLILLSNITWPVTPDDPLNITHDEYNLFDENQTCDDACVTSHSWTLGATFTPLEPVSVCKARWSG